jgi:PAS domain S-box-containing protein
LYRGMTDAPASRPASASGVSELLEDAIESIAEGFLLFDSSDRLIACNRRYRELYDLGPDEYQVGTLWSDLLRSNIALGRYAQSVGREEAFIAEREAQRRNPGDSYEMLLDNGTWLRASDRRTREGGMVSIRVDITEQKKTEQQLRVLEREARESEKRLLEIVGANPLPMTITRLSDGFVIYANQLVSDMVKVPLDELIGRRSPDFYADVSDRETVMRTLRENGRLEMYEVQFKRSDGSTFPLAVIAQVINYLGEPAVVAGLQDMSRWKQMEQALHQSEKLAALGSLLAGVAHELNNPLSVVLAQASLMKETAADEVIAKRSDKILVAAERCARIVKSFLAIARQRPPGHASIRIADVMAAALDLISYNLVSNGIDVEMELPPDLPMVWGDGDHLGQVFLNLFVNAQQALQGVQGKRRIRVEALVEPDQIAVRLSDNGPGIPPSIRSRIFDPFFTTKPVGSGTGVGLSVCMGIVTAHGGTIALEETPGGGATFVVTLPTTAKAQAGGEARPVEAILATAGRAILIVDDEPEIAALLAEILAPLAERIDVAENGLAALTRLQDARYDLIISDLSMPDLDGPGLFQRLRAEPARATQRFMFVTGDTLNPNLSEFLATSGAPVLEKPFQLDDVRRQVAQLLTN